MDQEAETSAKEQRRQDKEQQKQARAAEKKARLAERRAKRTGVMFFNSVPLDKAPQGDGLLEIKKESLRMLIPYKKGKREGVAEIFKDDVLVTRLTFLQDKKQGAAFNFYPNGNVETEFCYKDDLIEGSLTLYTNNQVKQFDMIMHKGVREGEFRAYDQYGDLCQLGTYKAGLLEGPCTTFYPKDLGGGICMVEFYEKGLRVKEQTFYYPTGEPMQQTPYDEGRALAYPTSYDRSGKIR